MQCITRQLLEGKMVAAWIISGLAAWLWIMCRNNMVDDIPSGVVAALMLFPAAIAGPFNWINVAISEYHGRIK